MRSVSFRIIREFTDVIIVITTSRLREVMVCRLGAQKLEIDKNSFQK